MTAGPCARSNSSCDECLENVSVSSPFNCALWPLMLKPVIRTQSFVLFPVFVVRATETMHRLPGGKGAAALQSLPPE